jgi:hypothetical protein
MNDLDDKIRNALSPDDSQMIGSPDDGLRIDQLAFSTLRSRNWAITGMMVFVSIIIMGLSIWCAIRFFNAQETKELLGYGFAFLLGMFMISFMKVWFWMEMQRIAITREVKKVELLTARLLQELASR